MTTVNDTDTLLVNRGGSSYNVQIKDMSTLQDTDLLLINREGESYKVEAQYISTGPTESPPVIGNVSLVENDPGGDRFTSQNFTATSSIVNGVPTSLKTIDAYVEGTIIAAPETDSITNVVSSTVGGWNSADVAENNNFTSSCYGGGKFVAISYDGSKRVMTSPDGINWTGHAVPEDNPWMGVTYGNGKFVAVARDGSKPVMWSVDGVNWSAVSAPGPGSWYDVCYGDGKYVAVSNERTDNSVMYSTNGINWSATNAAQNNMWRGVTYGNGKFVAVGRSGTSKVMYSADAITWYPASAVNDNSWGSIAYGDGVFAAVANGGDGAQVMVSTDGINWTDGYLNESRGWTDITYGNGTFVAVSDNGEAIYSYGGSPFAASTPIQQNSWFAVAYGDGKFSAIANEGTNRVMWSNTGTDSGPSRVLTLDGNKDLEDFNLGDSVTSNPAGATGVLSVLDDSNPYTMTLSNTTGTWANSTTVVGPAKPTDNTRKYLQFDASGAVSSILSSAQDPPYTTTDTNPGLTLTFPATFPSGEAPDTELGEGTTLTVSYTAQNSSATVGPTTATVQPGSTNLRSLTQAEYTEQALKFGTYENRRDVKVGQDAQAKRHKLASDLQLEGYSPEEILKLLINNDKEGT